MEFRRLDDAPQRFYTDAGSEWHQLYKPSFDEHGNYDLVADKVVNIQEQIESHRDSVDLNIILKKYSNGDNSVLSRGNGVFMDTTGIPDNLIEMMNFVRDGEDSFNQLPLEVRERFGFNFASWLDSYGNDDWNEKMGLNSKPAEDVKKGVVEE